MKRIFDLIITIPGILIILPLLFILSILVMIFNGKPIVFSQIRPGQYGIPFRIFKFRTMNNIRDNKGNMLPDNQRITSFGSLLRSTSLDELPELINILKGEMSLVGPRPLLMEYLPLYTSEQNRRHNVKPGITGWAQVNGRNAINWDEKLKLDIWYVDHQSLWLDIKILAITMIQVILRKGVNYNRTETMPLFKGSKGSNVSN